MSVPFVRKTYPSFELTWKRFGQRYFVSIFVGMFSVALEKKITMLSVNTHGTSRTSKAESFCSEELNQYTCNHVDYFHCLPYKFLFLQLIINFFPSLLHSVDYLLVISSCVSLGESTGKNIEIINEFFLHSCSLVECSPATRTARVRFPADAYILEHDCVTLL